MPTARAGRGLQVRRHHRGRRACSRRPTRSRSCAETPPATGSVLWDLAYDWGDDDVDGGPAASGAASTPDRRSTRSTSAAGGATAATPAGCSSYQRARRRGSSSTCAARGFTHVELLPVMEHPFYGSWGYQVTGFFAPTSRYGTPQELMALIDQLHQAGIGVILDWVPSHFPTDAFALGDSTAPTSTSTPTPAAASTRTGTATSSTTAATRCAASSPRRPSTGSSAYHADGLRVDAVASMLYLDYSREPGEWIPNALRRAREPRRGGVPAPAQHGHLRRPPRRPDRSPRSRRPGRACRGPVDAGGLGFGLKWDMGWMHDTLAATCADDPVHRRYHHGELTFRAVYAFTENFVLPLSHDEVVHGKGSLLGEDARRRLAEVRQPAAAATATSTASPARSCSSWGTSSASGASGTTSAGLDWELLGDDRPRRASPAGSRDLNRLYRRASRRSTSSTPTRPASSGCSATRPTISVLSFLRRARDGDAGARGLQLHPGAAAQRAGRGARRRAPGASCSNSDADRATAAAAWATSAGWRPSRCRWHGRPRALNLTAAPARLPVPRAGGRGDAGADAGAVSLRVWPGSPHPLGATWDGEGVNFALFSEHATAVELCLFDDSGRAEPSATVSRCRWRPTGSGTPTCPTSARAPSTATGSTALRAREGPPLQPGTSCSSTLRQGV